MAIHGNVDGPVACRGGSVRMSTLFYRFTRGQRNLCAWFDQLLPTRYQVDGNSDFIHHWIGPYLKSGSHVYDIGGGKNSFIRLADMQRLRLRIAGGVIEPE